ncbi:S41 family peptidase [Actinacidiphila yeochonensis]|uniref:S41 family peptidase n=1 Tax=Actinacidiphila yeochonensis TaxID=89050 RepID=UPI0005683C64|nr:S41 family peptidase [Actinacidiphila yeochonensis]
MSGPSLFGTPRRWRRGAALTLACGAVLAAGAAAGSLTAPPAQARASRGQGAVHPALPAQASAPAAASAVTAAPKAPEAAPTAVPAARKPAAIIGGTPAADPRPTATATPSPDPVPTGQDAAGTLSASAARAAADRDGDRWASFYTAREYAGLQQALDGRYVGTGVSVRQADDGRVTITNIQRGSPAARAGLRGGDVLDTVGTASCAGEPVTEVVAALRGSGVPGSRVALGVRRGDRSWTVTVRRATLTTEPVTVTPRAGGPTVIAVDAFTKGVARQVRQAARTADHGVVLDLRGNSGGLVSEAVATASVFLDGGLVATYDVHGRQRALYAAAGRNTTAPLVVLVDGGTMSAAEMLSGALQDRGRAVVMGSRTFGKGAVQMPRRLSDGSVAELTVGHYLLPDGRDVEGRGITPDVEVPAGHDPVADSLDVFAGLGAAS